MFSAVVFFKMKHRINKILQMGFRSWSGLVWFGLVWFGLVLPWDEMAKVLIYTFALDDSNENEISSWEHTALDFSLKRLLQIPISSNFNFFIFAEDTGAGNAAEN